MAAPPIAAPEIQPPYVDADAGRMGLSGSRAGSTCTPDRDRDPRRLAGLVVLIASFLPWYAACASARSGPMTGLVRIGRIDVGDPFAGGGEGREQCGREQGTGVLVLDPSGAVVVRRGVHEPVADGDQPVSW